MPLAPVFARAADKDWDACVNGDGNDAYIGCEAFLKRGDTESAHDRAIAYSYLGRLKYIQGDFRGGIEEYTEAIKLDPTMAEAYAGRGWVHHAGSEYALAVADYEQALALRPDYTYLQGKLDAAKAALAGEPTPAATPAQQEAAVAPQPAAAAVAVVPPATPAVTLGTRVALVIGNSAYVSVPRLPNPTGDAEAIAQVLRADGFKSVTVVEDASRADMANALQAFQAEADHADWALVYYAGRGIEIGGTNYLVPTDARLKSDRNAPDEAISLSRVLDAISGAKKLKLVMLDACRDNPFAQSMERSVAVRSVARGLTRVEPEGGTLVVYAAKDGNVAEDGAGGHSPFAAALMTRLAEPNLEISKLLRLVTDDVLEATGNRQRPFVYGSVSGREDFYFTVK